MLVCVLVLVYLTATNAGLYDGFTGKPVQPDRAAELTRLNQIPWCARDIPECSENEGRRIDGTCNNLKHPPRGGPFGPFNRLLPPTFGADFKSRPAKSGLPLPNVRRLRVAVMSDGRRPDHDFTQLMAHVTIAITGEVSNVVLDTLNYVLFTTTCCAPGGDADPRCIPIYVPEDDPHLRRSDVRCLNLTRAITFQMAGCAPPTLPPERINLSPPMLEFSILYGSSEQVLRLVMEGRGGRLRTEREGDRIWPPSGAPTCVNNQLVQGETRCHAAPNPSVNSLIAGGMMYIWFYRNHNRLASALEAINPCWDNEKLFRVAREINIAYFQHIVYYELMPLLLGYDYLLKNYAIFETDGYVDDYDEKLLPLTSVEYITGTRWFHTMQEGRYNLYDGKGKLLRQLPVVDATFRPGVLPMNRTIEGMTQGAFRQPSAANDYVLDTDMGERVLGPLQRAADIISTDIMKGRDAGLQPYNNYRKICGLPVAYSFQDLRKWMYDEQVDAMELLYEDIEDVDLMVGILAEKPMHKSVMGPTLACIITDQLLRWRRADRFFYENSIHPGTFTLEQLNQVRRISMARVLCDNGDEVDAIQPMALLVPRPGNNIVPCSKIAAPQLYAWKDHKCQNTTLFEDLYK